MNEQTQARYQEEKVDSSNTSRGEICVFKMLPNQFGLDPFYVITIGSGNSVRGVVETCESLKEALGVARGLFKGIEIF